jgi:hypothetical protein
MPPPMNAPVAGEIWHLSIEDLFQPVQEAPRLGGEGPFVINLSVSTAPINIPAKSFTSRSDAHVYQIQVTEDGRTRYRLRLGPFSTEDEADAILAEVRDTYPGALTATASGSDLRVIESMQAKASQRQAAQKVAEKVAQKTTDKVVIENFLSQKISIDKVAPQKVAPQKAAQPTEPQKAPPVAALPKVEPPKVEPPKVELSKSGSQIIDAAVKAEIAKMDAEISIDIAWPLPELKVPPPPVAPARVAQAPAAPLAVKEVPSAPVVAKAITPVAQPAPPVAAPEAVTAWALPELDIPLPPVQIRPAVPKAPVLVATQAAAPKVVELKIEPPLSLVNEAPVLTEVVVPRKGAAKSSQQKPAISAPVLTEVVVPKGKASKKPAVAASSPKQSIATPAPTAPVAPLVAAKPVAPVVAAAPIAAPTIPTPVLPSIAVSAAPTVAPTVVPVPAQKVAASMAPPVAPVASVVPPLPRKPAYVLTQSLVTPRKPMTPKGRPGPAKAMPSKLTSLQHVIATAPAPAPREVKKLDEPLPDLESTQTIRALTPKELEDAEVSRWFVIQLALADHAFDPEAVPNLDIFSEYRLYSVAGLDQGRVVHALRLGFFREEIGAVAVASYLAAYWDKPTIKRVSVAERERFADQRVDARKDVGATGRHSVIEITDELVARRRRSGKAQASSNTPNRPNEP